MDIDSIVLRATRHSLTPWRINARPSFPRADGELLCKNLVAHCGTGCWSLWHVARCATWGICGAISRSCMLLDISENFPSRSHVSWVLQHLWQQIWNLSVGKCLITTDHLENLPNILLSRHVWWHCRSPCLSPWTCLSPGIVPLQRKAPQAGRQLPIKRNGWMNGWMPSMSSEHVKTFQLKPKKERRNDVTSWSSNTT